MDSFWRTCFGDVKETAYIQAQFGSSEENTVDCLRSKDSQQSMTDQCTGEVPGNLKK